MLELLSKHYAHEVVIARETEATKRNEPERVAAYVLECLECDEELIYKQTEEEKKRLYSVWIDGAEVNDYYLSAQEAKKLRNKYIKDGYTNATIRQEREKENDYSTKTN